MVMKITEIMRPLTPGEALISAAKQIAQNNRVDLDVSLLSND